MKTYYSIFATKDNVLTEISDFFVHMILWEQVPEFESPEDAIKWYEEITIRYEDAKQHYNENQEYSKFFRGHPYTVSLPDQIQIIKTYRL